MDAQTADAQPVALAIVPVLSDAQRVMILEHYTAGYSPRTTYQALWPGKQPAMSPREFLRQYIGVVEEYLAGLREHAAAALPTQLARTVTELEAARDRLGTLLKNAEGRTAAQLANAMAAIVGRLLALRELELREAAALQSLLVSNAEHDGNLLVTDSETKGGT